MADVIQSPVKGRDLRAQWGADVAEMLNRHERTLAAGEAVPWVNRRGRNGRLEPFAVRYSEAASRFEVYLPAGSVADEGHSVLLTAAADADWYVIQGASALATGNHQFSVFAHYKPRVRPNGSSNIAPALAVTAQEDVGGVPAPSSKSKAGDSHTVLVARCTVATTTENNETHVSRTVEQRFSGVLHGVQPRYSGPLDLYWQAPAVGNDVMTMTPHVPATDNAPICHRSLADAALSASGESSAYYIVGCSGSDPEPSVASSADSSAAKLSVLVYRLSDGCVVDDFRASLAEQVFYR